MSEDLNFSTELNATAVPNCKTTCKPTLKHLFLPIQNHLHQGALMGYHFAPGLPKSVLIELPEDKLSLRLSLSSQKSTSVISFCYLGSATKAKFKTLLRSLTQSNT